MPARPRMSLEPSPLAPRYQRRARLTIVRGARQSCRGQIRPIRCISPPTQGPPSNSSAKSSERQVHAPHAFIRSVGSCAFRFRGARGFPERASAAERAWFLDRRERRAERAQERISTLEEIRVPIRESPGAPSVLTSETALVRCANGHESDRGGARPRILPREPRIPVEERRKMRYSALFCKVKR